ncbi:hypothetical protein [Staphylococcus coagulans]|uniref:hypothetical protein n=1 Tax=Staphylococcus coagulans TaxID=74706 RepID=UPI0030EC115C
MEIKKKVLILSSCALLLSPISLQFTEKIDSSHQAQAAKAKYKLVKTNTFTKTISQQNKEDAEVAIATSLIGGGAQL